jgi:hypothetical protein
MSRIPRETYAGGPGSTYRHLLDMSLSRDNTQVYAPSEAITPTIDSSSSSPKTDPMIKVFTPEKDLPSLVKFSGAMVLGYGKPFTRTDDDYNIIQGEWSMHRLDGFNDFYGASRTSVPNISPTQSIMNPLSEGCDFLSEKSDLPIGAKPTAVLIRNQRLFGDSPNDELRIKFACPSFEKLAVQSGVLYPKRNETGRPFFNILDIVTTNSEMRILYKQGLFVMSSLYLQNTVPNGEYRMTPLVEFSREPIMSQPQPEFSISTKAYMSFTHEFTKAADLVVGEIMPQLDSDNIKPILVRNFSTDPLAQLTFYDLVLQKFYQQQPDYQGKMISLMTNPRPFEPRTFDNNPPSIIFADPNYPREKNGVDSVIEIDFSSIS